MTMTALYFVVQMLKYETDYHSFYSVFYILSSELAGTLSSFLSQTEASSLKILDNFGCCLNHHLAQAYK